MVPNLRVGGTFCEDRGWSEAASRYRAFCKAHSDDRVLYLELGVGDNTPAIIKYPFWNAVGRNGHATYACVNIEGACAPATIAGRSILVDGDIATFI
ncbi:MAG: Sir2 silent information regulator family NAD-dependent deacetylase, partial [Parolsenella sp.]|nr:Sir2 silent information regulator family NAD-dependent deacetylase [Parolsenella sp.]